MTGADAIREPMEPIPCRVVKRRQETEDVFTFELKPADGRPQVFAPGQFNMLYAFGLGEIPVSLSGDPDQSETMVHTIRTVGAVSRGLGELKLRQTVGVRGPFGTGWPLALAEGKDVVIAAGGLGLAPLRALLHALVNHPAHDRQVTLLYGARDVGELLFLGELERWKQSGLLDVHLAVDHASREWTGTVGHVTALVPRLKLRPRGTIAMICGPEIMMRFTAMELEARGLPPDHIFISLERNMKCAIRVCGHCQLGPHFVCADGPIYPYARIAPWLRVRAV
jgi:NAD(P)H-flavin reductase